MAYEPRTMNVPDEAIQAEIYARNAANEFYGRDGQ